MVVKRPGDSVDDEVEKVGLIAQIAVRAGKHHPVGAARRQHPGPRIFQVPKESPPGETAVRGPALATACVHGLVIQAFDLAVQVRVNDRLKAGGPIKIKAEIEEPAGSKARQEAGQGGGQVDKQWDTVMDASMQVDNGESMAEEMTRELVRERLAAGDGSKMRGLHAGALSGYLDELTADPITDWKTAIQNFPATIKQMQIHYTLKRPDRRELSPYGKRKEHEPSIILCIDSSGSVSDEMLGDFLSQANALLRHAEELRVVIADAAVQDSYKYKAGMSERLKKVAGRGGTDFDPAIIYINKELARDFDGVIYLTDGYCPVPQTPCKLPVLWVVCGNETFEGKPKVIIPDKRRNRY